MEYVIILALQSLGIYFHFIHKVSNLGDKHPGKKRNEIVSLFWDEDWDTVAGSGGILILHLLIHYIIDRYTPDLRHSFNYYELYAFGVALCGGYFGQRWLYKAFGSAEKKLDQVTENILK